MLQVKQTLDCLHLSSFSDQPNTPTFCLAKWIKNMISKDSKSLILFPDFQWSCMHCEDWCMHRYRIVTTSFTILDQVGTSRNRSFGVRAGVIQAQVIPWSPYCSYRTPISQQRGPWHFPRQNPDENPENLIDYPESRGYSFAVWAGVQKVLINTHFSSHCRNVASACGEVIVHRSADRLAWFTCLLRKTCSIVEFRSPNVIWVWPIFKFSNQRFVNDKLVSGKSSNLVMHSL